MRRVASEEVQFAPAASGVGFVVSSAPFKSARPDLDRGHHWVIGGLIAATIAAGLIYAVESIAADVDATEPTASSLAPYVAIFFALLMALSFEFVNGFHDTANAVATVIYTRSLPPHAAVVWSGIANLLGVLSSSGAVAFAVIALLPVELTLQVGSSTGIAMVFALLIAAIVWNLGTWYLGLPVSSSHTMIGSIVGVGVASALVSGRAGASGVNWSKATEIGYSLLLSPVFGFVLAGLLLLMLKFAAGGTAVRRGAQGDAPPSWEIRGILILTCSAVSFFHGANDGQKGMNLVMLILIGTLPHAYALNRAMTPRQMQQFQTSSAAASKVIDGKAFGYGLIGDPRPAVARYVSQHDIDEGTYPCLAAVVRSIAEEMTEYGSLAKIPARRVASTRNDMYLASEAVRLLMKDRASELSPDDAATIGAYRKSLDGATKFIPLWVKVAVAIALGVGTMIGWKRIVVTVGERIGKAHLSFAQGACAEITAAATIAVADGFGLPISTTHVLSSGIAGTMTASGAGLQWRTIRNILLAWAFTLPAAMLLSGGLYWIFSRLL
jgi:inorganic phosphate transporter, PiT family